MDFDPAEFAYVPTTGVRRGHQTPLVPASNHSLEGYGRLVDAPESFPIGIVRWPAQGWRPIDENSGDQGGVVEGVFEFWWKGETLYARNNAVGDTYLFGWSNWPEEAATNGPVKPRRRALIWRAIITSMGASYSVRCGARVSPYRLRCRETMWHRSGSSR